MQTRYKIFAKCNSAETVLFHMIPNSTYKISNFFIIKLRDIGSSDFRVQNFGFRVQCSGYEAQGLEFRAWGNE